MFVAKMPQMRKKSVERHKRLGLTYLVNPNHIFIKCDFMLL